MLNGFVFALLPVMWIVWNAMWLYNVTVRSGKFGLYGLQVSRPLAPF